MPLSRLQDLDAHELLIIGRRPPVSPVRSIFAGAYAGIAFTLAPAVVALFLPIDLHVPSIMIGGAVAGAGIGALAALGFVLPTPHD